MVYHDKSGGGYPPPPRDNQDPQYPPPRDEREAQYPPPPPRDEREPQYPPRDERESQYPPPPGEEDDRARAYHHRGPSTGSITLPSISPYDNQYAQPSNGYGPGTSTQPPNGYGPGPSTQAPNGYGPGPANYQHDPFRTPSGGYRDDRGYQQDYGRGGAQHMAFSQSAPRQRTAIACRYCRRRKIRCSGFESNPEGRCANCCRFQQECIFTPVSSQAQAFVPAHTVFPSMRNMAIGPDGQPRPIYPQGSQLFGAHGQPLGPVPPQGGPSSNQQYGRAGPSANDGYGRGGPSHPPANEAYGQSGPSRGNQGYGQPQQGSPYEYPAPSPTGSYSSVDRASQSSNSDSRKRTRQEPHPTTLPPPMPNQPPFGRSDGSGRRPAVEDDLRLPPVTPTGGQSSSYSPASSTSTHSTLQPPQSQSNFPSRTPPPRTSPGEGRSDPMRLGSIMESRPETEIDKSMLGRLGRKGKGPE